MKTDLALLDLTDAAERVASGAVSSVALTEACLDRAGAWQASRNCFIRIDSAAAMEAARGYMLERRQFGQRLADFQALQFKLADMATELDAARLMLRRAAQSLDTSDPDATLHCAMAKRLVTDAGSMSATRRCSCTAATAT